MKFIVIFALFVAVASAQPVERQSDRILNIIEAILNHWNRPPISVGPAIIGGSPISVGPVEEESPIFVGPAIVEEESPISVGPAIVEEESPIFVGPAIVEEESPAFVGPAIVEEIKPTPVIPNFSSPLVNVIINVNTGSSVQGTPVIVAPSPVEQPEIEPTPVVVVEQPEIEPTPVIVVEQPEIEPTPVIVVEQPEIEPTPVIVVEQPEVAPEAIIVAPIEPAPVMTLPEILN